MNRRHFLIALASLLAGCRPEGISVPTAYSPGSRTSSPTPTPALAAAKVTLQPAPASVPVTDADHLYVHSYRTTPQVDPVQWSLRIDGLVQHPLIVSLAEIQALPVIESMRTLECIGNGVGGGLIGNVNWTGVSANELFSRVQVNSASTYARFEAADGYTTSVALSWLMQPDVLLAYVANRAPLLPEHGYPLRLLIPGLYGQKMPKWITRITFTDQESPGYWERPVYGWSNVAAVRTNSQIVAPVRTAAFTDPIRVTGLAYGGKRAIKKVEVGIGTEQAEKIVTWSPARLIQPPTPLAWTWWVYDWSPPAPGSYRLAVRATDVTGFTQARPANGLMAGAYPDGTDAIHAISVHVE